MFAKETNILVVDDMMTMRKLVKKALTELGFTQITDAENGAVAWEKVLQAAHTQPFGLIVSDWNMPALTGIELLRNVRGNARLQATPFVLLTAESEKGQVAEALSLKVNGYVVKPFTAAQLGETLKNAYASAQNLPKAA